MDDQVIPMSRQQRRATQRLEAARAAAADRLTVLPSGPKPLCKPGTHQLSEIVGTVDDKPVATMVACVVCLRTFQQIMEQSPDDLAMYRGFLEAEAAKVEHTHEPDPDGLPVEGCAGCARVAELVHASPESLG